MCSFYLVCFIQFVLYVVFYFYIVLFVCVCAAFYGVINDNNLIMYWFDILRQMNATSHVKFFRYNIVKLWSYVLALSKH